MEGLALPGILSLAPTARTRTRSRDDSTDNRQAVTSSNNTTERIGSRLRPMEQQGINCMKTTLLLCSRLFAFTMSFSY